MKIKSRKTVPFFTKEDGTYIDMMAGVFMMVCLFALILVMLGQAALVEKRLDIKTAIKNTLYIAEQQGGLYSADVDAFKTTLQSYGCTVNEIKINGSSSNLSNGGKQVPYGDRITLSVDVSFDNPLFKVIGKGNANGDGWFKTKNVSTQIHYSTEISSTSRW